MTNPAIPSQPVADLPLIREALLVEMEQRYLDGASAAELAEMRRQYDEICDRGRR